MDSVFSVGTAGWQLIADLPGGYLLKWVDFEKEKKNISSYLSNHWCIINQYKECPMFCCHAMMEALKTSIHLHTEITFYSMLHTFSNSPLWETTFIFHLLNNGIKKKEKKSCISTAWIRQSPHDLRIFVDWMLQWQRRTVTDEEQEWDCQGDTMKLSRPWITGVFVFHTNGSRVERCK